MEIKIQCETINMSHIGQGFKKNYQMLASLVDLMIWVQATAGSQDRGHISISLSAGVRAKPTLTEGVKKEIGQLLLCRLPPTSQLPPDYTTLGIPGEGTAYTITRSFSC